MPLYMHQLAYTPKSWAAQVKNPQIEWIGVPHRARPREAS